MDQKENRYRRSRYEDAGRTRETPEVGWLKPSAWVRQGLRGCGYTDHGGLSCQAKKVQYTMETNSQGSH